MMGISILIAVLLWLILYKTNLGRAVRAGVDDRETVSALGININRIYTSVFVLSGLLAGLAGVIGGSYLQLSPGGDTTILTLSLVVIIVGGMGSLMGAVVSSLILGQIMSFGLAFAPQYSYFLIFIPMALVLALTTSGPLREAVMKYFRENGLKAAFIGIATILLILLPYYVGQYTVTTFIRIIYFGFLSLSMGFLIGQGGMVSLTQTAFFGLSGYIIGLFGVEKGIMFPWPDLMGIGAVLILALLFGMIAMGTHKIVFLMITLAFGQVCWAFAAQNTTILRGWSGIRGIRPFVIYGINFNEYPEFLLGFLILFVLGIFVLWRISKSHLD